MLVSLDIPENKIPFMTELLNSLDFIPKNSTIPVNSGGINADSLEKGKFKANQKPSELAGLWKSDRRDLKTLRAKAWKQRP